MKKVIITVVSALLVLTSCEGVNELINFPIGQTFEYPVDLVINSADTNVFLQEIIIETASDPSFKDNVSNIVSYSVSTLSLRVADYQGADNIFANGQMVFVSDGVALESPIILPEIDFKKLHNSGEVLEIIIPEQTKRQIEANLINSNLVAIQLNGEVSDKPLSAEIIMAIRIDAEVQP